MRLTPIALLMLASCGPRPVNERDLSIDQAMAKMVEAGLTAQFLPGRWESSSAIDSATLAGADPEVAEALRRLRVSLPFAPVCVAAGQGSASASAAIPAEMRRDCSFKKFVATKTTLDAVLVCEGWKGPRALTMEMRGRFAPDRFHLEATSRTQPNLATKLSLASRYDLVHRGPCRGDELQGETTI